MSRENRIISVNHIDVIYRSAESLSIKKALNMVIKRKKISLLSHYKAISDVSFTLERGKVYGVIGNNGAGKSTLLKTLSGVMSPNQGTVTAKYKSINLLALGIGFSSELTGIDNIYLNGMLLGFPKNQIKRRIGEIIEYSELGDFIYRPMKTYSSGMVSRLGFSIAIHLKPEVLLIDETLSVGDMAFKEKSFKSIKQIIQNRDITVVMVSHSIGYIWELCDVVLWLEKGHLIMEGPPEIVLKLYERCSKGELTTQDIQQGRIQ
jgi:ABC-type polysaccharide/polyol phosphate transport system ATPase subunit